MDMTVVPMTKEHIPALYEIEKGCFANPWSEKALIDELSNPAATFLVAVTGDNRVAGYVGMLIAAGEGYFTNVAVSPEFRRQGVADRLLSALANEGTARGLSRLSLEVRVSNAPAIALYEKHGYKRDGIRPGFYRTPTEDAAIYLLAL